MDQQDFSTLLTEYNRLVSQVKDSYTESFDVIPILLKTGTFSPSRLEYWPFPQISEKMNTDPTYQIKIIDSFIQLASLNTESDSFLLNEKKCLAFLLAAREKCPKLLFQLLPAIKKLPRMILACLEYKIFIDANERFILELCRSIPIPFPLASSLLTKLKSQSPLLAAVLVQPSIDIAKSVLESLKESSNPALEYNLIAALECSARSLDSKDIYSQIITPIWGTKNIELARTVLTALSQCPHLEQFCYEYLKDL